MKPFTLFFSCCIFLTHVVTAQCYNSNPATYTHQLSTGSFTHFSNGEFQRESLYMDGDSLRTSIFSSSLAMGGYDDKGNLYVLHDTYSTHPYGTPGIIDDNTGLPYSSNCEDWNRFFIVTAEEVEIVLSDFDQHGMITVDVPSNILYYPAIGNPFFKDFYGFDLPEEKIGGLAAFVDRNNDGLYNPYDGDYPLIEGIEQVFWAFHTQDTISSNILQVPMEFLVSSSVTENDGVLANKINIRARYLGSKQLQDFQMSLFNDTELNCSSSSLVGFLPQKNLAFKYVNPELICPKYIRNIHGDIIEDNSYYPTSSPMAIVEFDVQSGATMSSNYEISPLNPFFSNLIFGDPLYYYNLMRGFHPDGTPMTYGGDGYNPNSTEIINFIYDHSENQSHEPWLLCEADSLTNPDFRYHSNFGPFVVNPGDVLTFNYTSYVIPEANNPCPSEADVLEIYEDVKNNLAFEQPQSNFTGKNDDETTKLSVFPNPSSAEVELALSSGNFDQYMISDSNGNNLMNTKLAASNQEVISLVDLPPGLYCILVYRDGSLIDSKRIMKK